jgi:hypothetical protein
METLSIEDNKGRAFIARSNAAVLSADKTAALQPFGGGRFLAMFNLYFV